MSKPCISCKSRRNRDCNGVICNKYVVDPSFLNERQLLDKYGEVLLSLVSVIEDLVVEAAPKDTENSYFKDLSYIAEVLRELKHD